MKYEILRFFAGANSFTLVELLVVIGIIAILSAATVIVLNPAEMLKQGRDVQRMSDLRNIQSIIERYKYTGNRIGSLGTVNVVYTSLVDATSSVCADLGLPSLASGWSYNCITSQTNLQKIDGTGWIPVNLSSTGLLAALPIDPTNTTSSLNYYSYLVNSNSQFELTATLESQKKLKDTAIKDGGTDPAKFETGETLALWTQASGLVGYWPFDEGGGSSAADLSGNGTTLSVLNLVNWVPGKVGSAVQMDPTISTGCVNQNAGVYTSSLPSVIQNLPLGVFTLSWWNNIPADSGQTQIQLATTISVSGCGNCSVWNRWGDVVIRDSAQDVSDISYPSVPSTNAWHHYVFIFDKTNLVTYLYVDGAQVKKGSLVSGGNYGTIQWIGVGVYHPACVDSIPGEKIDDVRIYNRALSAAEIQNIYTAEK